MVPSHRRIDWGLLFLDITRAVAHKMFIVGGIGCGLAVIYLGHGLMSGALRAYPVLSTTDQLRFINNIELAVQVLYYSSWALAAACVLWSPGRFAGGYALAAGGAFLLFALPFLLREFLGMTAVQNQAIYTISYRLLGSGRFLLTVGLVMCGLDALVQLRRTWIDTRKRREIEALKAALSPGHEHRDEVPSSLLRPFGRRCWEMPFCKDYMRKACPAYHVKQNCWRRKKGCLCDEDFILRVVQSGKGYRKNDLKWLMDQTGGKKRLLACKNCSLYLAHQKEKFAALSYLSLPAGVLAGYLAAPGIHGIYQSTLQILQKTIYQISFAPSQEAETAAVELTRSLQSNLIEWMLIVTLSIWVMNLYHRASELLILKLKW